MLNHKILVVEENIGDFHLVKDQLLTLGFNEAQVLQCASLSALTSPAIQEFQPSFVFMDLVLGEHSGVENFKLVSEAFPTVPVVILTSLEDEYTALECIKAGAQNYIIKGKSSIHRLQKTILFAVERNQLRVDFLKLKEDYERTFQLNPLPSFITNNDSTAFLNVNKAAIELYGYSLDEFLKLSPSYLDKVDYQFAETKKPGGKVKIHFKRNGCVMYAEVSSTFMPYRGQPCRLIIVNDVTEKVLAEQEGKKAQRRLEAIYNGTNDAILLTDNNGNYISCNPAAQRMLHYTEKELLALNVKNIVATEYKKSDFERKVWKKFLDNGSETGITELKTKKNERIICLYNATANILPGVHLSILTDITDAENARRELDDKNRQVEHVLDTIADSFIILDTACKVLYWNKAAEQQTGIDRENILDKNLWDIFSPQTNQVLFTQIKEAVNNQLPVHIDAYLPLARMRTGISIYPSKENITLYFSAGKSAQLELMKSRNNHEAVINASNDLIWSVDTELKIVSANNAFKKAMEYLTGKEVQEGDVIINDQFPQEIMDKWKKWYQDVLDGKRIKIDEEGYMKESGQFVSSEVSFNPIYDAENKVIGVSCYSRDMTDRRKQQLLIEKQNEELRAKEQHLEQLTASLKNIMDSSVDVICTVDKDGKFKEVSGASLAVWGYLPVELIGEVALEFIHPEDRQRTQEVGQVIKDGTKVNNFENRFIKKDGSVIPMLWAARWDEQKQTLFLIAKDATAIKKAELEKAQSEKKFSSLVQNGLDLIGILDENLNYKYISCSISRLGYNPAEMKDKNALNFIHPDDRPQVLNEVSKILSNKHAQTSNFRFRDAAGNWRWIETIASNLLDDPAIGGIVINARDITDRKEKEAERELIIKELTRSNNDLKQFSFITSHNLRAPLSNIIGLLNVIDRFNMNEINLQIMGMLEVSARQLKQTLDDLSRILLIKNSVGVDLSVINIKHVLNEVSRPFFNSLNDIAAEIHTDFQVKEIDFNKTYFESIFINLISNAIKYRSRERKLQITISTRKNDRNQTELRFSDNGIGIDLDRCGDRMFGLYQRFHHNTEGQGIGLFIIKSQITALGGRIDVESELNKGATFIITFRD